MYWKPGARVDSDKSEFFQFSSFFKPSFFEAALNVNLTTMLVLTTIFISKMEGWQAFLSIFIVAGMLYCWSNLEMCN